MRTLNLDALVADGGSEATFHDARVLGVRFDARSLLLELEVLIPVEYVSGQPQFKPGVLRFTRVALFSVEPQGLPFHAGAHGLWLSDEGSVDSLSGARYSVPSVPAPLADDAFLHYLFFSDINSFMYVAASEASFSWAPSQAEPKPNAV